MPAKSNSIAVRRSANHGLFTVAGVVDPGFWLRGAMPLDARSVEFSFSIVPPGNPTELPVTPRVASFFALTIPILPLNSAEQDIGIPVVNRLRSGAVPALSTDCAFRQK